MTPKELEELLGASRLGDGGMAIALQQRVRLLDTVNACLSELAASKGGGEPATCHVLLQAVRVLRNLCAGGPAACEELLLTLGALRAVSRLLALVEAAAMPLDWQLPLVGAQLLANAANASQACAGAVWEGTFPQHLNALAHIHSGEAH
jgi:hypothetical protein